MRSLLTTGTPRNGSAGPPSQTVRGRPSIGEGVIAGSLSLDLAMLRVLIRSGPHRFQSLPGDLYSLTLQSSVEAMAG
jgi:hypothetical protein